jgi:hypothetical protein
MTTYMLDNGLALRLGRASAFQDEDVILPCSIGPPAPGDPWHGVIGMWIRHAQIQSKVYLQLYSSKGLSDTPEHRTEGVLRLAEEIHAMIAESEACNEELRKSLQGSQWDDDTVQRDIRLIHASDMVSYYTTLTLIYQAVLVPSSPRPITLHEKGVESGRAAFTYHHECMRLTGPTIGRQAAYIHW